MSDYDYIDEIELPDLGVFDRVAGEYNHIMSTCDTDTASTILRRARVRRVVVANVKDCYL